MTTIDDYFKDRLEEAGKCNTLSPCPPIGDIENYLTEISSKGIELTVTYKPELGIRWSSYTLTALVADILKKKRDLKACLIGEFSETGVYHMHGSVYASPRTINGLRRKMAREIGRCEFKAIRWVESWVKYCLKRDNNSNLKKIIDYKELIYI